MTDDFRAAHATAPAWRDAAAAILLELGDLTPQHQLGFLYVTDSFADALNDIVVFMRQTTGVRQWVGTVGLGVVGTGKEYFDEPAMSVMVAPIADEAFRLFTDAEGDIGSVSQKHADWLAKRAEERAAEAGSNLGLVIISLPKTPLDGDASWRPSWDKRKC